MSDSIWKTIAAPSRSFMGLLNDELSRLGANYENSLPDLRSGSTLLLGSDYSGEHDGPPYLVFSFLMTTLESWAEWEPKRQLARQLHLKDSRRMSFKQLRDKMRQHALGPLLEAANCLNGLSLTIAVNKKCPSFFADPNPLDLSNPDFAPYTKWKPAVLEKAFFTVHVLGLLLAGLAAPNQSVLWFTDEDSIAANDERLRELTQLFAWVSTSYLEFGMGHLRCGTSKSDDGSRQIEDFLAIPDLAAGAINEQMSAKLNDPVKLHDVFWIRNGSLSDKTNEIAWWLAGSTHPLKRLLCVVEPNGNSDGHTVSWFHFYNQGP